MADIFLSILGISVSIGLIVIILVLLTPFLNKRYAAKWKYLIWIFLALRLLVPFSGMNGQFIMDMLPQTETSAVSGMEEKYTGTPAGAKVPSRRIIVEIPPQMTTPIKTQPGKNNTGITMLDIVAFVWLAGSIFFISVHLASYFYYRRQMLKEGKLIEDAHILCQMSGLEQELHIRRTIQAIEYDKAGSPMIIGFLKPVLVLPEEQYSHEELFFILKHELVHLKRGDVYLKLLFVTANAVHWFNPFIWIMQKEAVIDMELSCDERVTQGASYAVRKAYTETLMSMLHKQCARKTLLSTQFYGGINIMKRRFINILKNGKKNGISILICVVILTISFGTLAGCSITKNYTEKENIIKENTEKENIQKENIQKENIQNMPVQSKKEDIKTEQLPAGSSSVTGETLKNTTMLTFSKEGEQEQKQATLAAGDGYSIYLPDNEWQQSGSGIWKAAVNERVRIWITHFKNKSLDAANKELEDDGYVTVKDYDKWKQEGALVYHARLEVFENNVWGIFYCYPSDYEEGWGKELPVIADTFALTAVAGNVKNNSSSGTNEYLGVKDCKKIRTIVEEFAAAYFDGNTATIKKFLASTYEGEIDMYKGTGAISDLTVKGLSGTGGGKIENGRCVVSLEFRDSNYKDMFMYLTLVFIKQEGSWKIQFYGVEG